MNTNNLPNICNHIWIRAEVVSKPPRGANYTVGIDSRAPLTPSDCGLLISQGFTVSVERCSARTFKNHEYQKAGCRIVAPRSWMNAPQNACILGIRDFSQYLHVNSLSHRHMFFSHTFRKQQGWQNSLMRFVRGGGELLDYEYIVNAHGQRLTSFGVWGGIVAMVTGLLAWCRQTLSSAHVPEDLLDKTADLPLLEHVQNLLQLASGKDKVKIIIIGSTGRVGSGALEFANKLGLSVTEWDSSDTKNSGPFPELLEYDILINAVRLSPQENSPPFLTQKLIRQSPRRLSVIVDCACDTNDVRNKLPIIKECTTFSKPIRRLLSGENKTPPLDIIAIPNLPTLIPSSSSTAFSNQLVQHLIEAKTGWSSPIWSRCSKSFYYAIRPLLPAYTSTNVVSIMPLTAAQEFALTAHSFSSPQTGIVVRFKHQFNLKKFKKVVAALVNQHDILHSVYDRQTQTFTIGVPLDIEQFVTVTGDNKINRGYIRANSVIQQIPASGVSTVPCMQSIQKSLHLLNPAKGVNVLLNVDLNIDRHTVILGCAMHPLIADQLSVKIFLHQLLIAYDTGIYSLENPLQYSDYSKWLNRISKADYGHILKENNVKYWAKTLDDSMPILQPPTDYSRSKNRNLELEHCQMLLSFQQNVDIRRLQIILAEKMNQSESWILYSIFLAAYSIVLYRWTKEADLSISCEQSGRHIRSFRNTIGPLATYLHVRLGVDEKKTFAQFFDQVWNTVNKSSQHMDFPFSNIAKELTRLQKIERFKNCKDLDVLSTSCTRVMYTFLSSEENWSGMPILSENLSAKEFWFDKCYSPMDISLCVLQDEKDSYMLKMDYNPSLFQKESMNECLQQIGLILEQAARSVDQTIMSYSLTTPRALELLPNPYDVLDYKWPGPIPEMFDKMARKYPDRIAISYQNKNITYAQLFRATNQIANALKSMGIGSGQCVGIYGHRSPSVVLAILGILKSGSAYCMMDPKYPSGRIITCLGIAEITGWIQIRAAGAPPKEVISYLDSCKLSFRCSLPTVDEVERMFSEYPSSSSPDGVVIKKDSVAVITFTSGSTGRPKGVMGCHVSLTHFYPWMATRFGISFQDKFSMCSGIAHDPLQRDIFTPLFFGASIAIPTDNEIAEPGALAKWFYEHHITISCFTPAMGQLLTSDGDIKLRLMDFRLAFFVGDMLIKKNVEQLRSLAPKVTVINMFGSTETQRAVGYLELKPGGHLDAMKEVISCGTGMKDVQLLLINTAGKIAGIGELAEIYVRSPHIAKGYVGLPERSKKVFVPNPFHKSMSMPSGIDRCYRTGDLGRYNIKGNVECVGRADDQIKIRGFRIELGEVNAALSKHPLIKDCVSIVRKVDNRKEIASFVVLSSKATKDEHGKVDAYEMGHLLRQYLKERLPNYMVPAVVVVLSAMPLTANSKVNRKVLAKMVIKKGRSKKSSNLQRVLTPTEQTLIKVWSKALGVESLGIEDNFYDLGGDSLLATRLTLQMRKALPPAVSRNLTIKVLLENLTIAKLAKKLNQKQTETEMVNEKFNLVTEAKKVLSMEMNGLVDPSVAPYKFQKPKRIFITGGNGFLGAFLIEDLLKSTDATLICGIRGSTFDEAKQRLKKQLKALQIWKETYAKRIEVVVCDLSKSLLGLSKEAFGRLSQDVDAIVHCGALVHWLFPYEQLKSVNVNGTIEILRLAGHGRIKPVHHVSTTSVFDDPIHQNQSICMEDDKLSFASAANLSGGYPQSKWLAEKIVIAARQQGIPTSIYRPGYISGHSVRGQWVTDDFLCRLIKGCIQLKASPFQKPQSHEPGSYIPSVDMAPVDYVARAIINCVSSECALNKEFHVCNPSPYPFYQMFEKIRSFGYEIKALTYENWRKEVIKVVDVDNASGEGNALIPIFSQFNDGWINHLQHPPYGMLNITSLNQQVHPVITCPDVSTLMYTYMSYFIASKFVEAPDKEGAEKIDWERIGKGVTLLTRSNRSKL